MIKINIYILVTIDKYLRKGGSHEIILTAPGKIAERLQGLFPNMIWSINRMLPTQMVDSSKESTVQAAEKDKIKS